VLAGTFASAVMIGMSTSGALAAVGCEGTAGTSAVTSNPTQLNLQCMQPIFIPGQLLQTFGGSALVRTNGTTALHRQRPHVRSGMRDCVPAAVPEPIGHQQVFGELIAAFFPGKVG
jgi:hypothetical protein